VNLINRAVFFANGNLLQVRGDLTRRTVQIALDPKCEHPESMPFDFDPVERAQSQHTKLCIAALTMLKGFIDAGMPNRLQRPLLGSFEQWDRLISGCLVWLGFADPVATMALVEASDSEREADLELLRVWFENIPDPISLEEIQQYLESDPVKQLLITKGGWDRQAVGYRLRGLRHRIIGGYMLDSKAGHAGQSNWWITKDGNTHHQTIRQATENKRAGESVVTIGDHRITPASLNQPLNIRAEAILTHGHQSNPERAEQDER